MNFTFTEESSGNYSEYNYNSIEVHHYHTVTSNRHLDSAKNNVRFGNGRTLPAVDVVYVVVTQASVVKCTRT